MTWPVILKLRSILELIDMTTHVRVENDDLGAVCDLYASEVRRVISALESWLKEHDKRAPVLRRPCKQCGAGPGVDCLSGAGPTGALGGRGYHYARLTKAEHPYGKFTG